MVMINEAVVDSSVIIARYAAEEQSEWARQKMAEYAYFHVLDLNYYEVANALKYKISGSFTSKDAHAAWLEALKLMNLFALHSFSEVIDDALTVALKLNISVYDAAFVSLADRLGMRFLTLDEKLAKKLAETKYYRLVEFPNR
jgi:predicted nucleic acid-binding protein